MAVAFTNSKPWSLSHQFFSADWTLSGTVTEFDCGSHGLATVDAVVIQDNATLTETPYWSVSNGIITVSGLTSDGTGKIAVFGDPA